jgi:hypothetical protein
MLAIMEFWEPWRAALLDVTKQTNAAWTPIALAPRFTQEKSAFDVSVPNQ